jgi:hypothetical protein
MTLEDSIPTIFRKGPRARAPGVAAEALEGSVFCGHRIGILEITGGSIGNLQRP